MADPDITTRARAVLAGLTKHQRARLLELTATNGPSPCSGFVRARVTNNLTVKRVASVHALPTGHRYAEPTDLGREVARLLTEEADRG